MKSPHSGTARSRVFFHALLVSTALVAPAYAQVEQVVVTAQRKAEDIQNVPIQVTAFSSQDLAAHQITMGKDLQFATPNVTYSKTNFSGDDFTIRGIGNDVITGGGESGVAVSFDNVYVQGGVLNNGEFFDIDRIEVLEGPQSALYGRGATAGAVNIIPKKPDLESFEFTADASYGNYNANEERAALNIPIVEDQLGLRLSLDRAQHDGFVTNVANGDKIDSLDDISFRAIVRWQPTSSTTVDFLWTIYHKNDTTMRSERQECLYEPSGTLGCSPSGLGNDAINNNAFFATDIASQQAFAALGLPASMGLQNLQLQAPHVLNPSQAWNIYTDFNPTWRDNSSFEAVNWKQRVTPWLDFEANAGYTWGSSITQESYNNSAPQVIPAATLGSYCLLCSGAEGSLYTTLWFLASGGGINPQFGTFYANLYSRYFDTVPGELPVSNFAGLGISTYNIKYFTNTYSTIDQSNYESHQWSIDARFQTHLDGPLNFMLGAFYLRYGIGGDYFVSSGAQGYGSIALGAVTGLAEFGNFGDPQCLTSGCIFATPYYDNTTPGYADTLRSKSIYGETYYDIVPDLLKLTLGARWTDDEKSQEDQIFLFNKAVPIGTNSEQQLTGLPYLGYPGAPLPLNQQPLFGKECLVLGSCNVPLDFLKQGWNKITGRAVLDYTPKLDFTDQTLIYASYSRGYKAGGFNPGVSNFATQQGVQSFYTPEGIDAFEIGTKNTLLGDTLQANGDLWYYNYEGLQVSQILYNDSINVNVNSRMWGSEANFVFAPDEHWAFNLNVGYTNSSLGNGLFVDPRNPTAGAPNAVLIKDSTVSASAAQNCAVYLINGQTVSPADNSALAAAFATAGIADPYFDPPGGAGVLNSPQFGNIKYTNFGSCNPNFFQNQAVIGIMQANGYSFGSAHGIDQPGGVAQNIHGNENPNTPPWTLSFGAQYTFNLGNDYTLVPRFDLYYQTQMWGRIFEDGADKIKGYTVLNAQLQLNAPDGLWYVQGFVKNLADTTYVTGEYLTSSSSGLFTNEFLGDPRTYGVRVGVHF